MCRVASPESVPMQPKKGVVGSNWYDIKCPNILYLDVLYKKKRKVGNKLTRKIKF